LFWTSRDNTTITYSDDSFRVKILCNNYFFYCDTLKLKKKKEKKKKKVSGLARFGYRLIAFEPAQSIQRIRVFLLDGEKSCNYKYNTYSSSPPP